jgi:hypothetical protein
LDYLLGELASIGPARAHSGSPGRLIELGPALFLEAATGIEPVYRALQVPEEDEH